MDRFDQVAAELRAAPRRWLVTGVGGFIGSHLAEALIRLGQDVVGLDDFSTGRRSNVAGMSFRLIEGDIRDPAVCAEAMVGVRHVLHQAALGSVPRSIADPRTTHAVNVDGFVNVALAAVDAGVSGFVYASSSSVYGDSARLPKREGEEGRPLSPYAATKRIDEVYAAAFHQTYGLNAVGLRYFNVVGPRQDPNGAYAAVVPRWLAALRHGDPVTIFGDGETSRDFCPVANVVRANLLAAVAGPDAAGRAFNVGLGAQTTLNELFALLRDGMAARGCPCGGQSPRYEPFRKGDPRHSLADVEAVTTTLGFTPAMSLADGLAAAMDESVGR
ncbi:MAG: NAD-dependent epimerase/dehydratase family protein [Myxococcota bacterium]